MLYFLWRKNMTTKQEQIISTLRKVSHHPITRRMALAANSNRQETRRGPKSLLVLLYKEREGLTNSEISEALDIRPSSVTGLVNTLEEGGFITREASKTDKRSSKIVISESGISRIEERKQAAEDDFSDAFAGFSDKDEEKLSSLLESLYKNLQNTEEVDDTNDYLRGIRSQAEGLGRELSRSARHFGREVRRRFDDEI
jgi:DNA-binding MarR family transcriptional regulator